jgi:prepilin-type N-terminal cleavage/methylation domain-containing protein/prepilin-type processing-associated H-X9-DG protein
MARSRRSQRGFTLMEMLVVIAVLAVMVALLFPAIQRVREAANRTTCANNLKQCGVAFLAHQDKHGVLPDAGASWVDGRSISASGVPEVTPKQNWGCWYQILPYLGYPNEWSAKDDKISAGAVVPIYFCPTRRPPCAYPGVETPNLPSGPPFKRGAIDYAGSGGTTMDPFPAGATAFAGRKNGAIIPRSNSDHFSTSNIPDGASNTLLAGERNFNRKRSGDWGQYDENNGYFNGWDWDTMRWGHEVPAPDRFDDSNYDLKFGSSHPGGLNVLLADGSVHFLIFGIDLAIFQQLCDRNDGKTFSTNIWK